MSRFAAMEVSLSYRPYRERDVGRQAEPVLWPDSAASLAAPPRLLRSAHRVTLRPVRADS